VSGSAHPNLTLKGVKARVHPTYVEDGLFEITVGLCFLIGFLSRWTTALQWLAPVLIGIGLPAAKKRIAGLRVGYVDLGGAFKGDRRKQTILGLSLVMVILAALLAGFALARTGHLRSTPGLRLGVAIFMGVFCGGLFTGMALAYGLTRFYLYAAPFLVCTAILPLLNHPLSAIASLLPIVGVMVVTVGVGRLARFLHKHPRLPEAAASENGEGRNA
jgi:hypothetical protein